MPKKAKHTAHSKLRTYERAGGNIRQILNNLKYRKYIGLPRQTINRRVSAMKLSDKWYAVIWVKTSMKIVTVLKLNQYLERYEIPQTTIKRLENAGYRESKEKPTNEL